MEEVDGEAAPLSAAGVEPVPLHMQVPGAHCLRPQSVEQSNLATRGNAYLNISFNVDFNVDRKLTIRVLDALFLLRWF